MTSPRSRSDRSRWSAALAAIVLALGSGCIAVADAGPIRVEPRPSHHQPCHVPPGHLPPPGECRIWYPDLPPGQQPPPGNCYELERRVPPDACLVYGD